MDSRTTAAVQVSGVDGVAPGRPSRLRLPINTTVHPDTMSRLEELSKRFGAPRGHLIDRMVMILHAAYRTNKVLCVHGSTCIAGRTDLPEIF